MECPAGALTVPWDPDPGRTARPRGLLPQPPLGPRRREERHRLTRARRAAPFGLMRSQVWTGTGQAERPSPGCMRAPGGPRPPPAAPRHPTHHPAQPQAGLAGGPDGDAGRSHVRGGLQRLDDPGGLAEGAGPHHVLLPHPEPGGTTARAFLCGTGQRGRQETGDPRLFGDKGGSGVCLPVS